MDARTREVGVIIASLTVGRRIGSLRIILHIHLCFQERLIILSETRLLYVRLGWVKMGQHNTGRANAHPRVNLETSGSNWVTLV
jgi:hypothetical protein